MWLFKFRYSWGNDNVLKTITPTIAPLFWKKPQPDVKTFNHLASLTLLSVDLVSFSLSNSPTQNSPPDPGPTAVRPGRTDCWRHHFPVPCEDRWGSAGVFFRQGLKTFRFSSCFSSLYSSLPTIDLTRPRQWLTGVVTNRGTELMSRGWLGALFWYLVPVKLKFNNHKNKRLSPLFPLKTAYYFIFPIFSDAILWLSVQW